MKNKLSRKFAALALSTAFVVTGIAGVVTLNNNTVNATTVNAYEVSDENLSSDIKDIITELKKSTHIKDVYYVKDKPVNGSDGATHGNVSGIKVVFAAGDHTFSILENLNVTSLTYEDNAFGFLFDEYVDAGNFYFGFKDATANVTNFIKVEGDDTDTVSNPRMKLQIRQLVGNSDWRAYENIYHYKNGYGKSQVYTTNNDSDGDGTFEPNGPSRKGLNNVSFNFTYDNASNALYGDTEFSHRLIKFLNVKSSEYSNYDLKTKKDTKAVNSNYTNAKESQLFAGFTNNQASIAIRKFTDNTSIVITSLVGLDLTNENNAYSETTGAFSTVDDSYVKGFNAITNQTKLPVAAIVNPVTHAKVADATYTVNVYSGKRSSKQGVYGSNGYAYATAEAELGAAIATNVDVASYTFVDGGNYTLEYVASTGEKFYVDAKVLTEEQANPAINSTLINAKIYNGETEVLPGERVPLNTVLTVKPNEGYTLFGFKNYTDTPQVEINGEYVNLTKDGDVYTFKAEEKYNIEGSISVVAAAYEKKYTLTIIKDEATGETRTVYVYKGISSYWYDQKDWAGRTTVTGGFKRGTFYNSMHYDGNKLGIFSWAWDKVHELSSFKGCYVTMNNDTKVYKTASAGDYNQATGTTKGNFNVNAFEITSDATIKPCLIDFVPVADSAKMFLAGGKLNVSVEFSVDKAQYNEYIKVYGGLDKLNLQVVVGGYNYYNAYMTSDQTSDYNKNTYKFYNSAKEDESKPTILVKGIEASEVRGDKVFFKVTLTGLNDSAINQGALVFGLKYSPAPTNGGVAWFSNGDNYGFVVVDFKTEIQKLYSQVITTEEPVQGVYNAVEIDGVTYYAKYSTATIEKLVKYYNNTQV